MEKGSTVLLGVRKTKPFKQRKMKLFNKVLKYLKSYTYMFEPLLSYPSSGFPKPKNDIQFSAQGVGPKEPAKEDNGFLEKVGDYLSSDCYMYAPLIASHETDTRTRYQEPVRSHTRARVAVSTTKLTVKKHLSIHPLQDVVSHDGKFKAPPPPPRVHKHVVYQNGRSLSVTGEARLKTWQKKLP